MSMLLETLREVLCILQLHTQVGLLDTVKHPGFTIPIGSLVSHDMKFARNVTEILDCTGIYVLALAVNWGLVELLHEPGSEGHKILLCFVCKSNQY